MEDRQEREDTLPRDQFLCRTRVLSAEEEVLFFLEGMSRYRFSSIRRRTRTCLLSKQRSSHDERSPRSRVDARPIFKETSTLSPFFPSHLSPNDPLDGELHVWPSLRHRHRRRSPRTFLERRIHAWSKSFQETGSIPFPSPFFFIFCT